jgi:hypothetical protein
VVQQASGLGRGCAQLHVWSVDEVDMLGESLMTIMCWNGDDLPDELRDLPAGRYVVTPVDEVRELSAEEDEGLEQALSSLRAGEGIDHEVVRERIAVKLKR